MNNEKKPKLHLQNVRRSALNWWHRIPNFSQTDATKGTLALLNFKKQPEDLTECEIIHMYRQYCP